jgi:predicted TIM-barrel fold metal-dependent hydrolase
MKGYLKTQAEQKRFGLTERFEKLFQRLYFDTAGTGAWLPAMAAAFNITTADRIMFGSDYPLECKTAANLTESLNMVRQASCSDTDKTAILGKTAAGLFKL